ncbi:MAG TPA: serine/threonine-protein kinase [Terriglobales bacterium]|jgi:serine/threonine-protein kinase
MGTLIGTLLGRYEILGVVGRGSMGAVYKAHDPKIDRWVAIKTISLAGQEAGDEREYRERLFQEARAAGPLSHPGIVTIFDVGEEPETRDPFIVMEYVSGRSLDQVLHSQIEKKLPLGVTLRLAEKLAEALDYAHRQGVIHRDIKPTNILVTDEGEPKIADFGIARLNQGHLTRAGHLIGSPAYMAPEQLEGEEADARADLFSLGVVLYAMLTGHRPFQGNSAATVVFKVVHRAPVPVTALEAGLPRDLDDVVSRAMAKDPDERYQSGREFAEEVRRVRENCELEDAPTTARGASRLAKSNAGRRRTVATSARGAWPARARLIALSSAVLLITAAVTFYSVHHSRPPVPAASAAPVPEIANPAKVSVPPPVAPADAANVELPKATLHLEIAHHFSVARASIFIDGKPLYSRALKGASKKRALLFRETQGFESHNLTVEPGEHEMRVRMSAPKDAFDQSRTVAVNFSSRKTTTLRIACDKHQMELTLQ